MAKLKSYFVKLLLFCLILFVFDFAVSQILLTGLLKFYGFDKKPKILLIGHSHTMLGIDNVLLEKKTGKKVSKYAREGANSADRLLMIKHFMENNGDSVKIITYDVDAYFLTGEGLSANSYKIFYPFMQNDKIFQYIEANNPSRFDFAIKQVIRTSRFNDLNIKNSIMGFLQNYTNNKFTSVDTAWLKQVYKKGEFRKITFDKDARQEFEATLNYIANTNVKLVLILIPTIDLLNNTDTLNYHKAVDLLNQYAKNYKNVYFLNYNTLFADKYNYFYDPIHLNPKGQSAVTEKLAVDMDSLLKIQ